ncbi:hypothetical protein DFH06DRAFT_1423426 [Mycena polygramma]|nr:hypothetical protein DFH06DRAFT_1423426 [Mycena polygramma]
MLLPPNPTANECSPFISPIDLLPPELLCQIFIVAAEKTTVTSQIPASTEEILLGVPWVFGQVCSHWRTLSTSLTALWTAITVSTRISARELPLLQMQLARTSAAPIDVTVVFDTARRRSLRPQPSPEAFDDLLRRLLTHSARWRTLRMHFGIAAAAKTPQPVLRPETLTCLEALTFSGAHPALRRVALGSFSISHIGLFPRLALPWAQLTTYHATCNVATHLRALSAAPALIECDIGALGPRNTADAVQNTLVTLPHLRRLVVRHSGRYVTRHPAFLTYLIAPRLQSLVVTGSISDVLPFLQRSGCAPGVVELTLAACTSPTADVVAVLEHTPKLAALTIDLRNPPAELVTALASGVCPALCSLAWADLDDELDRDAFVDMVASRCGCTTASEKPMYSVALYAGRRRMKGAGMRLRALPGLDVVIMNCKKGRPVVARWCDSRS